MKETILITDDISQEIEVTNLINEGYTVQCMSCGNCYKTTPRIFYRYDDMEIKECRCGSDLFISLQEVLEKQCKKTTIGNVIIDNEPTIILKERNFKYCTCTVKDERNRVHTGDAETQCRGMRSPLVIENTPNYTKFKCDVSGFIVIIIKEDNKTLKELIDGNEYFITPIGDKLRNVKTTNIY